MDKKWLKYLAAAFTFTASWFLGKYVLQLVGFDHRFDFLSSDINLKRIVNVVLVIAFWLTNYKLARMFRMPRAFAQSSQDFQQFIKLAITGLVLMHAYLFAQTVLTLTNINIFNIVLAVQEIMRFAHILGPTEWISSDISSFIFSLMSLLVTSALMVESIGLLRLIKMVWVWVSSAFLTQHQSGQVRKTEGFGV